MRWKPVCGSWMRSRSTTPVAPARIKVMMTALDSSSVESLNSASAPSGCVTSFSAQARLPMLEISWSGSLRPVSDST